MINFVCDFRVAKMKIIIHYPLSIINYETC